MKKMRKLASLILVMAMVFAMTMTAFAADNGKITINRTENVSVAGKTFNAYKILNLEMVGEGANAGYVYTVPAELADFYVTYFATLNITLDKESGNFDYQVAEAIKGLGGNNSTALFAFAKSALAAAKDAEVEPETATAGENATSVEISGLPLGYYVIEDNGTATPISALMLDTTNPNISINIKADKPSIDKKIDGANDTDDSTSGMVEFNNAAIGDKVPYVLTSKVPDMTGYTKYFYVVNDTLSAGLKFNNDVVIKIGEETLEKDTDYTVSFVENGTTSVKIVFKNFIECEEGADIVIKYSATVDTDAVIGTAGNPNKVQLTYSNNPNEDYGGIDEPTSNDPVGVTPEEITRTYVTNLIIDKVNDKDIKLAGAEFTLTGKKLNTVLVETDVFTEDANGAFWKLKDGSYTTVDPNGENMDQTNYADLTKKYSVRTIQQVITKTENVTYQGTTGADGKLRFEGLSAGTYEITEIKAPAGYNLLQDPIEVTIGWEAPNAGETECKWSYAGATYDNVVEVLNQAGAELPSTGGIGTTVFYVVGIIMMMGAAVVLVNRKRMEA